MPDRVDLGSIRLEGGYFLLQDATRNHKPYQTPEPESDATYRHCYTYEHSSQDIKQALLNILRSAKHKIFVASFRIGDADLLDTLYAAADRLRGGVYVITALDEVSLRRGLQEIEDDSGGDIQAQNKRFDKMTQRGIYLRGHSSCHAKFVVVDDEVALISSANLETRAFRDTGENGIVVTDCKEVDRLARFFTRLWYSGCDWEVLPGRAYAVTKRAAAPSPCTVPLPQLCSAGVIWTHHDEQFILHAIHDVIGQAKRDLILATFNLCGLSDRPDILFSPLRQVMEKCQLRVRLLLRARNHIEGLRRDTEALAQMGVEIYADSLTHAKAAIADRRHGALFSANFDVHHGLISGVEVGTRLDGETALEAATNYFEHAIENADRRFVLRPTQKEMDRWLDARWRKPWPYGDVVRVEASSRDWSSLESTVSSGPILYSRREDGPIYLYAGGGRWQLESLASQGTARLVLLETPDKDSADGTSGLLSD